MLAAAVECIVDEGYYRASSNRIAQRAGVTWGVIQYHFGTREKLLLAVARDGAEELVRLLSRAEIAGDTLEERVGSLVDIIWAHYRRPAFLAGVQIVLNLSKDPRTGDDTVAALADSERSIADQWQRLVDDVLPGDDRRRALGTVIYEIVRGTAIGAGLMDAMPHLGPKARAGEDTRAALVRALTLLVTAG